MTVFGNKKLKVSSYLFEFIVLFLSIYFAFELEERDEAQDFTDREVAYLASMHQDLTKDINQLNRRIVEYDEKINSAYKVLELIEDSFYRNKDQISKEFKSNLFSHFNYNLNNSTLETLMNGGDLKLIKNHEFKILLSELGKSYNTTEHQWEKFNDYTEGLEWSGFFINNFNMKTFETFSTDPNFTILLQNRISHFIALIERYFFQLQGTLKKTEEVKSSLESEMTSRNISFLSVHGTNKGNQETIDELDDLLDDIESKPEDSQIQEEEDDLTIDQNTDDLLDEIEQMDN